MRCVFLPHAGPNVGINRLDTRNRFHRIPSNLNARPTFTGKSLSVLHDLGFRLEARWGGDADRSSEFCADQKQGMADVAPIAHVGQAQAVKASELFAQSEEVTQSLAGVSEIG